MFELSRGYTFVMYEGSPLDGPAEFSATVIGYNHPLVKVRYHSSDEQIINASSPAFISATLKKDQ